MRRGGGDGRVGWEGWVVSGIVVALVTGLAREVASPPKVFAAALAALVALSPASPRLPDAGALLAAFGNEALWTIAALFVLSGGVTRSGALAHVTRWLGRPRSVAGAQLRLMAPVIGASAVLNNTPVVAMMIPVVKGWAREAGLDPRKLLLPLSYAAVLGGVCTLIGTSTNLVVQGLLRQADLPTFGFFTLGWIGAPVAAAGVLYVLAVSRFWSPRPRDGAPDVDLPETVEGHPGRAAVLLALFVASAALEPITGVPVVVSAVVAAALSVALRVLSFEAAWRSVDGGLLLCIGAALALAKALEQSGAAGAAADALMSLLAPLGAWGVLAGVYLVTLLLTEAVTNNAAAALGFPLAVAAAAQVDAPFTPFAIAVAIAASGGFATPMGYQTHMMVFLAGRYRFRDVALLGLGLDLVVMAVALTLIPLVFPLR